VRKKSLKTPSINYKNFLSIAPLDITTNLFLTHPVYFIHVFDWDIFFYFFPIDLYQLFYYGLNIYFRLYLQYKILNMFLVLGEITEEHRIDN